MKRILISIVSLVLGLYSSFAQAGSNNLISFQEKPGLFPLSEAGKPVPLYISSEDWPGVIRAFKDFQADIQKVTGTRPKLSIIQIPKEKEVVVAGTIGKSPLIDKLVQDKKITASAIMGKWESFIIQVVPDPFPGVKKALVIAGSDKRGTIFGIYELSARIGVSPWYWWSDVPVKHHPELWVAPGPHIEGEPSVKYRGIFLNDEAPALTNWVIAKYGMLPEGTDPPIPGGVGNYGSEFYSRIFEVLLRMKANYLWPAMWNNAFNEDDRDNARLADEYGIVMGTSHQEPMLRAQKEWDRRYWNSLGRWNYVKHPDVLENFWREGIRRNKNFESIITIGLRGANDTEMMPGGPEANIPFLEKIIEKQRRIIADETGREVTSIPQMWCLYKEVQEYYQKGLRVPDDVTLLWAEDNWGNIRRLPTADERKRSGGAGIYYHFDYHGGPRSYQWINTNPIAKIWDQMSLAKEYGADRIWIVNAGHFKGYELPVEFFLDLAWNSPAFNGENLREFTMQWATEQFGAEYSNEIAEILATYTRYNSRRKPELLAPDTYSLVNYGEAERVVNEYKALAQKADSLYFKLPVEYRDAYYQLVLFPTGASALVNELYHTAGKNHLYEKQGRAATNDMADATQKLFERDTALMNYFNTQLAGGRWNHFMDQTHLGYRSWADPPVNSLDAIKLKRLVIPEAAAMGISLEGSEDAWPGATREAILPESDIFGKQERYIDIFNKGKAEFDYKIVPSEPWFIVSEAAGKISKEKRVQIRFDWAKIPPGKTTGTLTLQGAGTEVKVQAKVFNPTDISPETLTGFVEQEGYVSMEAEHFSGKTDQGECRWIRIEDFGHTLSGMRAVTPVDHPPLKPGIDAPVLEYRMYLFTTGNIEVLATFSPTLNFIPGRALQYGVSFDDAPPVTEELVPANFFAHNGNSDWEKSVSDNQRTSYTIHKISTPGYHTLKIWMGDPGVTLQKIVVNAGGLKSSYLGPPETFIAPGLSQGQ
ncbi:MAG: glycosyl hydrolase 115 family protein [Bacteroidales bacterium]